MVSSWIVFLYHSVSSRCDCPRGAIRCSCDATSTSSRNTSIYHVSASASWSWITTGICEPSTAGMGSLRKTSTTPDTIPVTLTTREVTNRTNVFQLHHAKCRLPTSLQLPLEPGAAAELRGEGVPRMVHVGQGRGLVPAGREATWTWTHRCSWRPLEETNTVADSIHEQGSARHYRIIPGER